MQPPYFLTAAKEIRRLHWRLGNELLPLRAMHGTPRRLLKENMAKPLATEFDVLCLSMDEEEGELGDGLEDLDIDVELFSHAESCETGEFQSLAARNSAGRLFSVSAIAPH